MSANDSAVEKSIANQLIFGAKMQKRALCESWEFAVESPHLIRAMNAYGAMNSGYSCLGGVEDRNGIIVPDEFGWSLDRYNQEESQ